MGVLNSCYNMSIHLFIHSFQTSWQTFLNKLIYMQLFDFYLFLFHCSYEPTCLFNNRCVIKRFNSEIIFPVVLSSDLKPVVINRFGHQRETIHSVEREN